MSTPQEELQRLLEYNPETGLWRWRPGFGGNGKKQGWFNGSPDGHGYSRVKIHGRLHYIHRLAWLYIYGEWPAEDIDHLNGNRSDNRITNLRAVSKSLNSFSSDLRSTNTSGFKGVRYYYGLKKPWRASITHQRRQTYKFFETREEAVEWRRVMELTLFHELSTRSVKGA